MRYSEKKYDFKIENPIQLVVMLVYSIVSSPFRLMSEISKKIIFLGVYASKFFFCSIVLNTLLIAGVLLKGLFIDKKINFTNGSLSVSSLVVSFCIEIILYFVYLSFSRDLTTDDYAEETQEETSDDEPRVATPKPVNDPLLNGNAEINSLLDELNKLDCEEDGGTLTEQLDTLEEVDDLTDTDLDRIVSRIPKSRIDPVYAHEVETSDLLMAEKLARLNNENTYSDFDLEALDELNTSVNTKFNDDIGFDADALVKAIDNSDPSADDVERAMIDGRNRNRQNNDLLKNMYIN